MPGSPSRRDSALDPSPLSSRSSWAASLWPALPLLAIHAALLAVGDLAGRLGLTLGLMAAAFGALAFAYRRLRGATRLAPTILGVAAALRLLALPLQPTLSDDLQRYIWDGRVLAAGENPYRWSPGDPRLAPLRDELWRELPHKEVPTVYPPIALGLFAFASLTPEPHLAIKAALAGGDLLGCWLLLLLAARLGLPAERALWYAWNPLVILEVAGMGHLDGLAVAGAIGAVLALSLSRPAAAGLSAALGALAKLGPLAALPAWGRQSGRRWRLWGVAAAVCGLAFLPFLAWTGSLPPGLVTYGVSWEFNGPLYEPLWRLVEAAGLDAFLAHRVDDLKAWTGHHSALNRLYPYLYPRLIAKILLACGMLTVVWRSWRGRRLVATAGRLFGGLLLLSATVYPWYLLWVLPWAALALHPAWLALSGLILLSYVPQFSALPLWPGLFLLIWLPFGALLWRGRAWSTD